jgi:hypothetical protein
LGFFPRGSSKIFGSPLFIWIQFSNYLFWNWVLSCSYAPRGSFAFFFLAPSGSPMLGRLESIGR